MIGLVTTTAAGRVAAARLSAALPETRTYDVRERGQAACDQQTVPSPTVLVHQQHRAALRVHARRKARGLDLH